MDEKIVELVGNAVSIIWEAFPFVVLGAVVAGFLEEFVPQQAITSIVPRNAFVGVMLGSMLGIIFPMCECGIVPVMRRLLRKGLPLGICVAYMLAGPIINLVVIGSTIVAFRRFDETYLVFGKEVSIGILIPVLRIGLAFVVATVTALIVQAQYRKHGNSLLTPTAAPPAPAATGTTSLPVVEGGAVHPAEKRAGEKRPMARRIANVSETALHDFVDIMVFLTIGSFLAGIARLWLLPGDAELAAASQDQPAIAIGGMMLTAVAMCLCSEADAFVAASFTRLHMSAKLSFLVLGPMFDLKLLLMFTRVFRPRVILTIFLCLVIQVFAYTMLVHYLIPKPQ